MAAPGFCAVHYGTWSWHCSARIRDDCHSAELSHRQPGRLSRHGGAGVIFRDAPLHRSRSRGGGEHDCQPPAQRAAGRSHRRDVGRGTYSDDLCGGFGHYLVRHRRAASVGALHGVDSGLHVDFAGRSESHRSAAADSFAILLPAPRASPPIAGRYTRSQNSLLLAAAAGSRDCPRPGRLGGIGSM